MYLLRPQLSNLYTHLATTHNSASPPILILTALTVDALCAVRILTSLLKRDFIPHTVVPVSGYADLQDAGERLVQPLLRQRGGDGGRVVCVGCGGGVDLSEVLLGQGGDEAEGSTAGEEGHGVEVWVVDARRPWNLENVFGNGFAGAGVKEGRVLEHYRSGKGGVIVWDDGDIAAEMAEVREAWFGLRDMPEITEEDIAMGGAENDDENEEAGNAEADGEPSSSQTKRKRSSSPADSEDDGGESEDERPCRRRRSNSGTPIPSSPGGNPLSNQLATSLSPSAAVPSSPPAPKALSLRQQKKDLLRLRRKHEATLEKYYDAGSWLSEPVSSMLYSLASDLGREDNELLWLAIVGIESVALSPFSSTSGQAGRSGDDVGRRSMGKLDLVKSLLRDEVRRLNPPSLDGRSQSDSSDAIPTHARSPTDMAIRLSPEPRFLLIRHWSLYDSMLHSTYLATRLHVWSESGRKRLHKLLAKMGISLQESQKGYVHLDLEIKKSLNQRLKKFAEQYNLDGLVPSDSGYDKGGWGFVRSWGWRGTLSAVDVATVVSAILEVGPSDSFASHDRQLGRWDNKRHPSYNHQLQHRGLPSPPHSSDSGLDDSTTAANGSANDTPDWTTQRFFAAFDALTPSTPSSASTGLTTLLKHIPVAQDLARAILRTGSALIAKKQIRHLRSFRMGVVREGPDVPTFTHPGALVKLASWVDEAVAVLEAEKGAKRKKEDEALVLGALDEGRGVYVVVGLGGGGVGGAGRVKSKAEIREREERRKRKAAEKAARKAEQARKRAEKKQLRRERLAANGDLDSDEDGGEESDATESDTSSTSSTSSASDSDDDASDAEDGLTKRKRQGRNRFGQAFQEVVEETGARVRIDSFEHSVVEIRKEDLAGFLEGLSLKSVVG